MRILCRTIAIYVALSLRATFSYSQSSYIELGIAPGLSFFRDKATSPLFYIGNTLSFIGAWHSTNNSNERLASISYTSGKHTNNYNNTNNSARFYNLELNFSKLYLLNRLSSDKWKTKIGAGVISTLNIRENKALMNNSLGIENISNIVFSTKITRDILHLFSSKTKFQYGKKNKSPTKRELSFLLNIGIVNLNYRPGYAYNYLPSIDNSYVRNMSDHHLSINGFRLNSGIQYSKFLSNKNILRISYIFDAYNAPGQHEPFNYAKHSLKFSLLYNYK